MKASISWKDAHQGMLHKKIWLLHYTQKVTSGSFPDSVLTCVDWALNWQNCWTFFIWTGIPQKCCNCKRSKRSYTSACRSSNLSRKFRQGILTGFLCRNFMIKCFKPKFCAETFGTCQNSEPNFGTLPKLSAWYYISARRCRHHMGLFT